MIEPKKKRLQYLDIARGIAMICIVLGHLKISQINRIVFTFHVPLFFFITGYFSKTTISKKEFIKKQVRVLIIPYIVTCLSIIVLAVVKNEVFQGDESTVFVIKKWVLASLYGAGDAYKYPFTIYSIGAIWFLLASFWGSVMLRFLLDCKKSTRIVTVIIVFVVSEWSRSLFWFPFSIQAGGCALLFMYLGHLLHSAMNHLKKLDVETKIVGTIFALVVWVEFIINFKSFWLVHGDIGRGLIDIFGCICACYIVILLSKLIEKYTKILTKVLSYVGRYSLVVLCLHIIELKIIRWSIITEWATSYGVSETVSICMIIVGKFIWIFAGMAILLHINATRRLFGYKVTA